MFLTYGAGIDRVSSGGNYTALYLACNAGHVTIVDLLLSCGADPSIAGIDGKTPLTYATSRNDVEMVRCLVKHESVRKAINAQDIRGRTALWYGC